jgi:hypothetical protein
MNNIPKQNIYSFSLKPEDYKIAIPSLVRSSIAEKIEITIEAEYTLLSK